MAILLLVGSVSFVMPSAIPEAEAQTAHMTVSASNPNFTSSPSYSGTVTGPQVVQVEINDPAISSTTTSQPEPDVTVNGDALRMVQDDTGKWYGYFADKDQTLAADGINPTATATSGLQYGTGCSVILPISDPAGIVDFGLSPVNIDFSDTVGVFLPGQTSKEGAGTPGSLVICSPTSEPGSRITNVLREPPSLTNTPQGFGQLDIHPNAWPFIQLYDFTLDGDIEITYHRAGGSQTVTVLFAEADQFANLTLDRATYPQHAHVHATIQDIHLNIDPTDEDSWTWNTTTGEVYYGLFDENGNRDADGTTAAIDLTPHLANLMFQDNGVLLLDPNASLGGVIVDLENNNDQILAGSDGIANKATLTIPAGGQPVTFVETSNVSGIFTNFDENNESNVRILPDADRGLSAEFTYNNVMTVFITQFNFGTLSILETSEWNSGEEFTVQLIDNDENRNSLVDEDLDLHNGNVTAIPALRIGTPLTLAELESAFVDAFPRLSIAEIQPNSDRAMLSGDIAINLSSGDSVKFRLDPVGGNFSDLYNTIYDPTGTFTGNNFFNYDLRSFNNSIINGNIDSVDIKIRDEPSSGLETIVATGVALQGTIPLDAATGDDLFGFDPNRQIILEFVFNTSGFPTITTGHIYPVVADFISFGIINDGVLSTERISNQIIRAELEETGQNTGTFEGTLAPNIAIQIDLFNPPGPPIGSTIAGNPEFMVIEGMTGVNAPRVFYNDLGADGVFTPISDSEDVPSHTAAVSFDKTQYNFGEAAIITVIDRDASFDPDIVDIYTVVDPATGDPASDTVGESGHPVLNSGPLGIMMEVTIDGDMWADSNITANCLTDLTSKGVTETSLHKTGFVFLESFFGSPDPNSDEFTGSFIVPEYYCKPGQDTATNTNGLILEAKFNDFRDAANNLFVPTASAQIGIPLGTNGQIVFSANDAGNNKIYTMNSDGTRQNEITSGPVDLDPVFSPDGTKIAFRHDIGTNHEIFVMDSDGTNLLNISNNPSFDNTPTWSPDGTQIAFESGRSGNNDIWVTNADGTGSPIQITTDGGIDFDPAWSPDGTVIAFASNRSGNFDIWTENADGSGNPVQITTDGNSESNPAWSPTGQQITYRHDIGSNQEIFVINSDGSGIPTNLTQDPASDSQPAWSPDGTKIIFRSLRGSTDIWVMNSDGTGQTNLSNNSVSVNSAHWGTLPNISGDSANVSSATGTGTIQGDINIGTFSSFTAVDESTLPTAGKPPLSFPHGFVAFEITGLSTSSPDTVDLTFTFPSNLSPGTQYWKVISGVWTDATSALSTTHLDGDNTITLSIQDNGPFDSDPALGTIVDDGGASPPTNGQILFHSNGSISPGINVMNPDGTAITNIDSDSFDIWSKWSPDGTQITFTSQRLSHGQEIYVMDADGNNDVRLTDAAFASQQSSWSPLGDKIVFVSNRADVGNNDIYTMDADGSNQQRITTVSDHENAPEWSPDGTQIVYERNVPGNAQEIFVMNEDGTGQINISNNFSNDRWPDWSPDGNLIAFETTRNSNPDIYVMDKFGGNLAQVTSDTNNDRWPIWSPDGTKILFISDRSGDSEFYTIDYPSLTNLTLIPMNIDFAGTPDWGTNITVLDTSDSSSVISATGTGTIQGDVPFGTFSSFTAIDESTLPTTGKPARTFPHGFVGFTITGLSTSSPDTVDITLTFPNNLTPGTQYWKVHGGTWIDATSALGASNLDGDNVLTLSITDNGPFDSDPALGVITDPGGPTFSNPGDIYIASDFTDLILRFSGHDGAFIEEFVSSGVGGLDLPKDVVFGPDENLYVLNSLPSQILRYDGNTGAFIDVFIDLGSHGIVSGDSIMFGPDDDFYIGGESPKEIFRFDGTTGSLIGIFTSGATIDRPIDFKWGPDGNLYAISFNTDEVLRFNGNNGVFIDTFVTSGSGGLDFPTSLNFGPDDNLYVTALSPDGVLRYDGNTGAFIDSFLSSGFSDPDDSRFGSDGNFYITSTGDDSIKQFDGTTGQFISTFVSSQSGGLNTPRGFVFGPSSIEITYPIEGTIIATDIPTISGNAESGTTVIVTEGANTIGSTIVDGAGNWFIPVFPATLSQGLHTITASSTTGAGNPVNYSVTFTVDSTTFLTIDIPPSGQFIYSITTPTITGTGEIGATIDVLDGSTIISNTIVDGSGNWFTTLPVLSEGSHTFQVRATDAVNNVFLTGLGVEIDLTPPAAPVITSPSSGSTTNDDTPTISGTAEANSTVEVFDVASSLGTTTADGTGNWSHTLSAQPDGTLSLTATATDAASNESAASSPAVSLTITSVTPVLTWNDTQYEIEHNGQLTIDYAPANTDINSRQSFSATVVSDVYPSGITIQMREENNNSSIFVSESWVRFTGGPLPGPYTIPVSDGTTAKAEYLGAESSPVGIVQTTNTPPLTNPLLNIITPYDCTGLNDNDGDSICDAWENSGAGLIVVDDDGGSFNTINFGVYFVDCTPVAMLHPDVAAANGGNPLCPSPTKADVYLEIDYMELHGPPLSALHDINKAFYEAPYTPPGCPTCQSGINLHILLDDADSASIGHQDEITVATINTGGGNTNPAPTDFDQIKHNHFGTAAERAATDIIPVKAMIYHYGLIAHDLAAGDKGATGIAESPGNDFVVSLGSLNDGFGSPTDLAGTIMHELGHNFNLKHGGPESQGGPNNDQDDGCKPNYLSVMNYAYQIPNNVSDRPLDFSAHNRAGTTIPLDIIETSIDETTPYITGDTRWTKFAHGTGDPQDIRTTDSNDATGVDWNADGFKTGIVTDANVNDFGFRGCENDTGGPDQKTLVSLDDWNNLVFNFQASGTYYDGVHNNPADIIELTSEIIIQMRSALLNGLLNQILALPDSAFNDPLTDRQTFIDDITAIDGFVTLDELEVASVLLQDLRTKLDGSDGGDPSDDLITDAAAQAQLLPQIDNILDSWTLAVEPAGQPHEGESAQLRKQQVADDLEELKSQAQENNTVKNLDKAIKDVQDSLKPNLWISEDRLDPKQGHKVFNKEKSSVKDLDKIINKDKESSGFLTSIQQAIGELVDIDRVLSQTAIDDAQVFAGDPKADKQLEKANKEMQKAQDDVDDGKPAQAIDHYKKAWKHAQKAMKLGDNNEDNLVFNGSFEKPVVTRNNGWTVYEDGTDQLHWTVKWTQDNDECEPQLEIQREILGGAAEGKQHAELDTHCSEDDEEPTSVSISQTIDTISGATYELSYSSKERPNTFSHTNALQVNLNDDTINEIITMSSDWETNNHQFTATGPTTIEFVDVGTSDSYGTFLDNVQVILVSDETVPDPEPEDDDKKDKDKKNDKDDDKKDKDKKNDKDDDDDDE